MEQLLNFIILQAGVINSHEFCMCQRVSAWDIEEPDGRIVADLSLNSVVSAGVFTDSWGWRGFCPAGPFISSSAACSQSCSAYRRQIIQPIPPVHAQGTRTHGGIALFGHSNNLHLRQCNKLCVKNGWRVSSFSCWTKMKHRTLSASFALRVWVVVIMVWSGIKVRLIHGLNASRTQLLIVTFYLIL